VVIVVVVVIDVEGNRRVCLWFHTIPKVGGEGG